MSSIPTVELARDCEVVQIPSGTAVTLPKGTAVDITQTLGGSFTVQTQGSLFRLANKDADALGLSPAPEDAAVPSTSNRVSEAKVWEILRSCYDPEIPVNIVDLGLVYEMELKPLPNGNHKVDVRMTLTAPGCGMGGVIAGDAQQKLLMLDDVEEAIVEIVWDPPWHQSRITPEGRKVLGLED